MTEMLDPNVPVAGQGDEGDRGTDQTNHKVPVAMIPFSWTAPKRTDLRAEVVNIAMIRGTTTVQASTANLSQTK